MATTPNVGFTELEIKQINPENTINDNYRVSDILLQCTVLDNTLTTPPGSPANGDTYIPAATATGAWATYENYIAAYYGAWYFIPPEVGWTVYSTQDSGFITWGGSTWAKTKMEPEVLDTEFRVVKSTDSTSKMDFDMSKVATATTTTFIMPNGDVEFAKTKLDATTAPTVNDDVDLDYEPGSIWVDQTGNKGYLCVDNTNGAAIWREMAAATGSGDVTGPASSVDNTVATADGTGGKTIQYTGVVIDDNDALYGHFAKLQEKTANYTLVGTDSGQVITVNSASNLTITLPQTSTESIAAGFQCVIARRGTGTVTFATEGSDTLETVDSNTTIANRYGAVTIIKQAAGSPNTWMAFGDLG